MSEHSGEHEPFLCTQAHGPLDGTFACEAHMAWELWRFGRLIRWGAFAVTTPAYIGRTEHSC